MIKSLAKLADHLDSKGLRKEADRVDAIIRKIAGGKEMLDELARQLAAPLSVERGFNQPRPVPTNPPSITRLMAELNLNLMTLRNTWAEDKNMANHDRIENDSYIIKGGNPAKLIESVIKEMNERQSDYQFESKIERLSVGEGSKITWLLAA